MKDFLAFLKSKLFLRNLIYLFTGALTLFMILLFYLNIYTHHGRSILVPDFSELPVDDAKKIIRQQHLRFDILDSIYVATSDPGVIIDQYPRAGASVKKNRRIYFTINANSPEQMLMPDLVGITLREARARINVAGLKLGKLSYRYSIAKNVVLEQQLDGTIINPGDTLVKGSEIDLILGKGLSDEKTMVPDLIGLTFDQAVNKASDAFFTINTSIPDETVESNSDIKPFIFRHHPPHKESILVPLGTQITVWVTTDSMKLPEFSGELSNDQAWDETNNVNDGETIEDDSYDYDDPE